mgnify:CR=1 FL=1
MVKEIHLHEIFQGMSKELQFIIVGLVLMAVGWYLPKSFIAFLVSVAGIVILMIGIGKSIEYARG